MTPTDRQPPHARGNADTRNAAVPGDGERPSSLVRVYPAPLTDEAAWLEETARRTHTRVAEAGGCSPHAVTLLPERWARRFGVAPLAATDSWIEVATAEPHDLECERAIAFATGRHVRFSLATPRQIREWIDRAYGSEDPERSATDRAEADLGPAAEVQHLTPEAEGADDRREGGDDITRLVDRLLAAGVTAGASDVHLEPEERVLAVRHRIDGVLRDVRSLPRNIGPALASRVKILSGLDIADRLRPQDGRTRIAINGRPLDLRVSTLPAAHGEKIVIRILDAGASERSLDSMGFAPAELERVARLLEAREGLILVTGPTGSGKTTTLYAALREIKQRGVNIVTVEDPIEYRIPGIVQVQVRERSGLTFAAALRSIMRQDPDVILVGEIRDRETAEIAIQASLTGHLVLSTLHTNDAASAATRLADMGIPPVKVATALKGVIAQRLLRRACGACSRPAPLGDRGIRYALAAETPVVEPAGCEACGGSGYRGRLPIVEVLLASPAVERAIAAGESAEGVAVAGRHGGMTSLWQCGLAHALAGATTLDELLRVAEPPARVASPAAIPRRRIATEEPLHSAEPLAGSHVTEIRVGTIDVYAVRRTAEGWRVLVLQRSLDTRCPTAWETVHGRLEEGEEPDTGALRELREETGLTPERFYVISVQPYYLKIQRNVQLSVVFAAFVAEPAAVTLGPEHQAFEWLPVDEAMRRFAWPRERQGLEEIVELFGSDEPAPVEDVLRII